MHFVDEIIAQIRSQPSSAIALPVYDEQKRQIEQFLCGLVTVERASFSPSICFVADSPILTILCITRMI